MSEDMGIDEKFVKAWSEIENPKLDSVNPHFGNRFASLHEVERVIKKACAPYGIAYEIHTNLGNSGFYYYSLIRDVDGTVIELSKWPGCKAEDPQEKGADSTYSQRRLGCMDWGISGEEDDDGEAASGEGGAPADDAAQWREREFERARAAFRRYEHEGHDGGKLLEWAKANIGDKNQSEYTAAEARAFAEHCVNVANDAAELNGHGRPLG